MDMTTLWENVKGRIIYLKEHGLKLGEGVEIAQALTEEMERIYKEIKGVKALIRDIDDRLMAVEDKQK